MTRAPSEAQRIKDAFAQVQQMQRDEEPLDAQQARRLESILRPVAQLPDMQTAVVPMLDRIGMWSLAMAWDSDPRLGDVEWLEARLQRWLKLGAPELAWVMLAQMQREGHEVAELKPRAREALESERAERRPCFERNLEAMATADPELAEEVAECQRLSVGLKPVGSGVGEVGPTGWPSVEIFAPGHDVAREQASQALDELDQQSAAVIMGTGDAALLFEAEQRLRADPSWLPTSSCLHVVEPRLARVRATLEIGDLRMPLRSGRIRLHSGTRLQRPLAEALEVPSETPVSLLAADPEVLALFR